MRLPASSLLIAALLAASTGRVLATPPQANDDFYTLDSLTLNVDAPGLLANDSGGSGALHISGYTLPDAGVIDVVFTNGGFRYTPAYRFDGVASFKYMSVDEANRSSTATVFIDARPSLPSAVDDSFITRAGVTLTVSAPGLLANDIGGIGQKIVAGFAPVAIGRLDFVVTDGGFQYTPPSRFVGSTRFDYFAEDELGRRSVATVHIAVVPEPSPWLLLLAGAPLLARRRRRAA